MVIRRIDDLGRLQLPKDYRKTLDIHEGDELVIELKDGYMSVKKEEKKIGEEGMERLTKAKRLIELVNNPYCLGPTALLEGVKEVIPALIAENELLRQERDSQQRVAIREMEKVDKLTKDKDEQAGRIMKLEKVAKDLYFAYVNKDIDCPHEFETRAIEKYIDLLGGKEDANS